MMARRRQRMVISKVQALHGTQEIRAMQAEKRNHNKHHLAMVEGVKAV